MTENRTKKYQMKIWSEKKISNEVDRINHAYNEKHGLNQLNGLNRSKVINFCMEMYIKDAKFQKKVIDSILNGE